METGLVVYVTAVVVVGLFVLLRVLYYLRRSTETRKNRLRRRGAVEAVQTDSPHDDPTKLAKERGFESIETFTTATRRLLVPIVVLVAVGAVSLPFLERVPAAVLSILVAALTVLVSIAARPIIENAIAGLVISSSRLIHIGDTIKVDDWYGTVEDITTTHTAIRLWDWRRYVLPNSQMLQTPVLNYTLFDQFQWGCVEFWVSYEADLELVEKLAVASTDGSEHFAGYEPARFWIMEMAREGVRCWVAAWADSPSDSWLLTHGMRTRLIRSFRAHGIHAHTYRHELMDPAGLAEVTRETKDPSRARRARRD
jgi:small-conductance mechanosensitive channel